MRHSSFATSVVLSLAVLGFTACGDAPTDAALENDVQLSATRAAPTPAAGQQGGGAVVSRSSSPFFILVYDVETELLAAHMPSDVCASGNFNVFEVQRVETPSDVVPPGRGQGRAAAGALKWDVGPDTGSGPDVR